MSKLASRLLLFFNGFILIVIGAINTWQLAHEKYVDSIIFGFFSAFVWSITVRRIAFSHFVDRLFYSAGAALGIVVGLEILKWMYH
jgi:hypothetical protein